MEFATQQVQIAEGVNIRAQIWDTAGQERYRAITNAYYRQAIGVLLVYDITNLRSFESLEKWLLEVREHADEKIQIILIGNKNDLQAKREVSRELQFIESSALTANNVDTAFYQLISRIHIQLKNGFFNDRIEQFNYFGNNKIRQDLLLSRDGQSSALLDQSVDESSKLYQ